MLKKPKGDKQWVNGGFLLNKKIFNYLGDSKTVWEKEPLENLAKDDESNVFKHEGFWQPMDTLRDKLLLDKLWNENKAKWKIW